MLQLCLKAITLIFCGTSLLGALLSLARLHLLTAIIFLLLDVQNKEKHKQTLNSTNGNLNILKYLTVSTVMALLLHFYNETS